jgi:putative heme-binding domain-containing protein
MKAPFSRAILLLFLSLNVLGARRVPWATSRIQGSPEKPSKYRLERIHPGISFTNPVDLTYNTNLARWFVAEQGGRIFTFDADGKKLQLAADFGPLQGRDGNLYAITFDPGFATNHWVYLCYVLKSDLPNGSHVSRFTVKTESEPSIDMGSELLLITWLSGGHNGCCLKFGKDGYLYISTGDGAGPNPPDTFRTGQNVTDLLSSVLRIDVHQKSDGKNYAIPKDNPFANDAKARPEVWAYGLRNPWRMGFDAKTGDLWVADVGWELWELVYKIKPGGNYGWSVFEGRQPVVPDQPRGPGPIIPPLKDHPHSEAASITGGYVYYGSKYPELKGAFIYGDWETRKVWGLRADGDKVTYSELLADSNVRVVSFAEDQNGEIAILDYQGGLYSLEPNPRATMPQDFPTKLSQTGLFSSTARHEVAPGVVPFQVNAEFWNDHASAERFVALPFETTINASERPWKYPTSAVLARTISMEMERGNPASRRRLETQILHFSEIGWGAYTYRWNEAQTDAELVPLAGAEEVLRVKDSLEPGGVRVQNWRYHSRTECLRCHNPWGGTALGFQPEQLRNGGEDTLERFIADGFFNPPPREKGKKLVSPYDSNNELSARARSYLFANCAHCHRDGAGGSVPTFMNYELPLDKLHMVGFRPIRGDLGLKDAKVVSAGQPFSSVLLFRNSAMGRSRMPYIGSYVVDEQGITLLREWVYSLDPKSGTSNANDLLTRLREEITRPDANLEKIAANNSARSSSALALAHALTHPSISVATKERIAETAVKSSNPLVHELFDRFLLPEARTVVSQAIAPKQEVLALKGDAKHGAALITDAARLSCLQCHQFQNTGRAFGPPLKQAALNKSRAELYDNILEPSRQIAPEYVLYTVDAGEDEQLSGIIVKQTDNEIILRDATATDRSIPRKSVKSLTPQKLSAMPEGLLAGLPAQDVADLLEALAAEASQQ